MKVKATTVKELREKLAEFPDDLIVTMRHDGKGHDYPVVMSDVKQLDSEPYFANSDVKNIKKQHLRIGII